MESGSSLAKKLEIGKMEYSRIRWVQFECRL